MSDGSITDTVRDSGSPVGIHKLAVFGAAPLLRQCTKMVSSEKPMLLYFLVSEQTV